MQKLILSLLCITGIALSVYIIHLGAQKPPEQTVYFEPARSPYTHFIAAQGLVESVYKNSSLGPTSPQLVTDVFVTVGQKVVKGDRLFQLDTRALEARKKTAQEDLRLARIEYENQKNQFSFYQNIKDRAAVSQQMYDQTRFQMELAAQAVEKARSALEQAEIEIERACIRAPFAGEVLQLNVRPGEYAQATGVDGQPLILFGDTTACHLRVEVDEEDAWRVQQGAQATAFVRGNPSIKIPLTYVYTEPYIVPKKMLSGVNQERVDTRVLQEVYAFDAATYPVYYGQLVDVFMQAIPDRISQ